MRGEFVRDLKPISSTDLGGTSEVDETLLVFRTSERDRAAFLLNKDHHEVMASIRRLRLIADYIKEKTQGCDSDPQHEERMRIFEESLSVLGEYASTNLQLWSGALDKSSSD